MLNITTEVVGSEANVDRRKAEKISLKEYVLEKLRTWINSLLEAERDEFLGRGRHQPLDSEHDNYRNGYRPRRINFFGLGEIELRVPRDRQGAFESEWLPERKGQDPELEAFLAEAFLAGCRRGTWLGLRRSTWGRSTTPSKSPALWRERPQSWKPGASGGWTASATNFSTWTGRAFRRGSTGT